jgi:hypothetical protein
VNSRIAASLSISLAVLTLLTGCGGGDVTTFEDASILSVSPAQVDVATDAELEPVRVFVRTSPDPRRTGASVCATSTGGAFPIVNVGLRLPDVIPGPVDPTTWEVTFEPEPDLSVEEHTGFLEVFLSSDPECEVRDGPITRIPYRISKVHGLAQPTPVTLWVRTETTADELRGSARIDMTGGAQHGWTARSLTSWLVLDTPEGITGSDVRFHVDPARVRSFFAYDRDESGAIEITGDTEGMTARTVRVTVQLALPVAKGTIPPDQPVGPARTFRVRGEGFTAQALERAPLVVEGVPEAVFTFLSNGDLSVQLPAALAAGGYRVVARNALGLTLSSPVLRLTAPLETPRALLPGAGADGQLLWDGARNTLLVLEPPATSYVQHSTTLRRHAFRSGQWTTATTSVDRLRRIGLSPDGTKLLATSDSDHALLALDPERLGLVGDCGIPLYIPSEPRSRAPLAVTFDGRAWVGMRNALMTFDSARGYRMTLVSPSLWYPSDDRPAQTITSRDGSRLLVSRPGGRAFLYHDATEPLHSDAFHANPAGAATFEAMSDDGGRVLSGVNVYDGDFALLGTLPGPTILSGDGRRAFTLERRSDWRTGGLAPLIHVFDVTAPVEGGGALPELGTVDLLDHDTCTPGERACAPTNSLAVTPDGRVLFAQTAGGVVVVPVPESLTAP